MKNNSYYRVGSKTFTNKILACIHATETNQEVEWAFYDNAFDKFDWTVEPNQTLDELYDKRAKELREKYDYIIILYSGGADSHNLLTSFLRQNLKVDELLVIHFEKGTVSVKNLDKNDQSSSNSLYSEHVLQTIPRLKDIHNLYPDIKITVSDLTDHVFDSYLKSNDDGWIENRRELLSPVSGVRWDIAAIDDVRKVLDKNQKIGVILGVCKPRSAINKFNDFVVGFTDRATNSGVENYLQGYDNATVEYFYWNPNAFEIICNQAHVIKKYLELNPVHQKIWTVPIGTKVYNLIHEKMLRNIIYSTWNNNWFQADKPILDWNREYDHWFLINHTESRAYQIWKEGINSMVKMASKYVYTNDNGPEGLVSFKKIYRVGKMKNESSN